MNNAYPLSFGQDKNDITLLVCLCHKYLFFLFFFFVFIKFLEPYQLWTSSGYFHELYYSWQIPMGFLCHLSTPAFNSVRYWQSIILLLFIYWENVLFLESTRSVFYSMQCFPCFFFPLFCQFFFSTLFQNILRLQIVRICINNIE